MIALVVTIIVLLILAAVAINLTIGENGIFTRAQNATEKWQEAEVNEQHEMNGVINFIDEYTKNQGPKKVADVVGGDKFDKTETIEDDNGKKVTIPKYFGVAKDSNTVVDEGIVITDGTNEFVWVPVDDESTMFEEQTATLTGVETTTNIYSKLRVRNGDLYSTGAPGTGKIREPDILNGEDTKLEHYQEMLGFENIKAMADSMVAEYKAMSGSIKKYHGFYIGRYELTGTVETPTVKAGKVLTSSETRKWYGLYKACQKVIENNSDVKSTMIYGCQWDETMSWLKNTQFNGKEDKIDTDSNSWGNYSGDLIETGSNEKYKANEIFDLAGNYMEWTQEAFVSTSRMIRGGLYYSSELSSQTAASRTNSVTDQSRRWYFD